MSYYHLKNIEDYNQAYKTSIEKPEEFWANIAEQNFKWRKNGHLF